MKAIRNIAIASTIAFSTLVFASVTASVAEAGPINSGGRADRGLDESRAGPVHPRNGYGPDPPSFKVSAAETGGRGRDDQPAGRPGGGGEVMRMRYGAPLVMAVVGLFGAGSSAFASHADASAASPVERA